jgi:hypothetical protein
MSPETSQWVEGKYPRMTHWLSLLRVMAAVC